MKSRFLSFLALALAAAAIARAEPLSVRQADAQFAQQAATAGLRAAYLATVADDAALMVFNAKDRAEIEHAVATRIADDAKFYAEPLLIEESASHDVGYVWGKYRLEFTRKSTGEHVTGYGKFVHVWKATAAGWQLFLDNWAGETGPATTPPTVTVHPAASPAVAPQSLRQAEEHFLRQAATDGIRPAFLAHIADDGTIMFLNAKGRAEIEKAVTTIPADARIFAEPKVVNEAAAGDLGYVWGKYRFAATVDGKPFSADGKFITIWKKQPDGAWRIVLDHGSQDPAPTATKS